MATLEDPKVSETKPLERRILESGDILELWRMLFTWRLTVTEPQNDGMCWSDAWCYDDQRAARTAFFRWNGEGEPAGWIKHPMSGRWQPSNLPVVTLDARFGRP